jgi:nucleotide-binding universal stress UspA family protein
MFQRVVVGADESDSARDAVRHATELAKMSGGTLHIVTAYKPRPMRSDSMPDEFRYTVGSDDHAQALLIDLSSRARATGVKAETHAETGDPADVIVKVAEQVQADLIVVGNKGMTGVRRVLGSVPNSVAHQAPCAVLIAQTT